MSTVSKIPGVFCGFSFAFCRERDEAHSELQGRHQHMISGGFLLVTLRLLWRDVWIPLWGYLLSPPSRKIVILLLSPGHCWGPNPAHVG